MDNNYDNNQKHSPGSPRELLQLTEKVEYKPQAKYFESHNNQQHSNYIMDKF